MSTHRMIEVRDYEWNDAQDGCRQRDALRAAILEFTGELTSEQLAHHEAQPPYENSRPDIARLYRAATG